MESFSGRASHRQLPTTSASRTDIRPSTAPLRHRQLALCSLASVASAAVQLGLLVCLAGCGREEPSAEEREGRAPRMEERAAGELDAMATTAAADAEVVALLDRMKAAVDAAPGNAERHGELGMAQEVNGFAAAALASYERAEALAPDDPRWPYYQALLVAHGGQLDIALVHLGRSLALAPDHPPAWLWRGTWLLDLAHAEPAAEAFARAQALGAGLPAQAGLAQALLRQGDAAGARALLQPLADAHGHPHLLKLLARAQQRLGDVEAARSALARVRHAEPLVWPDARSVAKRRFEASLNARLAAVRKLLARGELETALSAALRLRERNASHQGLLNTLSEVYRQLGRDDDALSVLRSASAEHPHHYPFHLQLAEHYMRAGADELASSHLDRALALNPALPWAHAQRGLLLLERNRLDAARAAFAEALRQDPQQAQVHYYVAMMAAAGRRWPDAIRSFAEAARLDPSFALAHIGLARSLAEVGRFEESQIALGRAQEVGTHAEEARAALEFLRSRATPG